MQVLKSIIVACITIACICLVPLTSHSADEMVPVYKLKPAWTSKRIAATFWGIARGDIDGDGHKDVIILEEKSLWRARLEGNTLVKDVEYSFPPYTRGLRIFLMNLDGKPGDEVVVSAIAYEHPASFILGFNGTTFVKRIAAIPWHVRVLTKNNHRMLVGQRSIPDEFFTGKIYELKFVDGTIERGDKLNLPRTTRLFEFAFAPRPDGKDILISLKGYARMKAYEQRGAKKKWKRFWKSGNRFGGTLRYVELKTRPPTQDLPQYQIPIYKEPLAVTSYGATVLVAAKQDLPLRNIIMKKPLIEGGNIVEFGFDDGLGFRENIATERLPGFIADYVADRDETTGATQLYVAVQTDPRYFQPGTQSAVVIFNLPSP